MTPPLLLRGARAAGYLGAASERDLSLTRGRIAAEPHPRAQVVDLSGYTLFPGLVNAHDHLELNHYPRTKFRERYDNAHQWGEDMSAHLDDEPFRTLRAYPLADRLFIGGLKNLLCGALTVAHHNPPHRALFAPDFPVRVLRRYGWAHSLHFSTDAEVVASYRHTPRTVPWFIHLAEGTDAVAQGEYARLKALGCVGQNTVLVHGVGLTPGDVADTCQVPAPGVQLVWCPTTNLYLLGTTLADAGWWRAHGGSLAIGSDSRLTADGDLLDELQAALRETTLAPADILPMVTGAAAAALRLGDVGHLETSAHADLIAIRSSDDDTLALCQSRRADLALVMRGGVPQIGDPDIMAKFPQVPTVAATLDGVPKSVHRDLARQIARCSLQEPGLMLLEDPLKRKSWF